MSTLQLLKSQRTRLEPIVREINAWLALLATGLALLYVVSFVGLHLPPLLSAAQNDDPVPRIERPDALGSTTLDPLQLLM